MSIFKCSAWLAKFLKSRGISIPDYRALYEYHCNQEEYLELKHLLSSLGSFNAVINDKGSCACLVFFCSEWYRREYQDKNGWSWESIWETLGYELAAIELSKVIPRGLEGYWKRPIHLYESERRNFLGSLFSEGGLPFQVLKEDGSRFHMLFERILKQNEQWQLMGYNTSQLVEKLLKTANLPQAFSSPTSIDLIARMADQLLMLVRNYDLERAAEPVIYLNSQNPKWRELFPIPLDNETGTDLLNGLLKTATSERKKYRNESKSWACVHFWHQTQPDKLKVKISLPAEVHFTLSKIPSTTRFELVLIEAGQQIASLGPGYAVISEGIARIMLRQHEIMAQRRDASSALYLVALVGGEEIGSRLIQSSTIALGEVPIGFEYKNERWEFVGQASFRTASEELLLVLPQDVGQIEKLEGEALISSSIDFFSYRTKKVQGKAVLLVHGEETYSISTGSAARGSIGVELDGNKLPWETKPSLTFAGLPKLQWLAETDELYRQGSRLYIGGKLPGHGVVQETLGTQYAAVRNQRGETLLRRKVGLLPSDFKIELRSGENPKQGSLLIYSQQPCLFQIEDDSVEMKQTKMEGYTELRVSTKGIPPANLPLAITPNLMADPITLLLPFPSSGCLAFDAKERPLKRDICVDELLGTRLYLFGRNGIPTKFEIEISLKGGSAKNVYYKWLYTVAEKPLEISVFGMREQIINLLSLQADIDQVVELRVFSNGQNDIYRIRRYATSLEYKPDVHRLTAIDYQEQKGELPVPVMMLLSDPMRRSKQLPPMDSEGVPTGEFYLPSLVGKSGPWLVVPEQDSAVSFRPMFLAGGWEPNAQSSEIQSLQKAVLMFDPTSEESSFTTVLDSMAKNPMHSGWEFLRALYENYGYLPLTTFEAWKALMRHIPALSMALFKFEMDPIFLGRIEAEFPILWEFIQIKDIHLAAQRFKAFLIVKKIPEETADVWVGKMLTKLTDAFPTYGKNIQNYLLGKEAGADSRIPLDIFRDIIVHDWYQELIRDKSDAIWPEYESYKLKSWALAQTNSVISFIPEMDYRNTVVFLPTFAAAVASGNALFTDVFEDSSETVFFLRQARDFDSKWFNSIYQYCLLNAVMNKKRTD